MEIERRNGHLHLLYSADDEEPDCHRCIHQCGDQSCDSCGAENFWRNYLRDDPVLAKKSKN
jgi:hypothetical protein